MDSIFYWVVPLAVAALALFWLLVCWLLMKITGWAALEEKFPSHNDMILKTLHFQSGGMRGVRLGNCIKFEICAGGLRISFWKLIAPFAGPAYIPWSQIRVTKAKFALFSAYDLSFGDPEAGKMLLARRVAERIAESSQGMLVLPRD